MMTLTLLVGLWTSTCIQTQIAPTHQGYVIESYEFNEEGEFKFTREWFKDSACSVSKELEQEEGTIKIGAKMSGMFISGDTFEADFQTVARTDYGALSVKEGKSLKVARGLKGSSFRNTMVGLFEYLKQ